MAEHLSPQGTASSQAEGAPPERAVHHVVQAHLNDLVDPFWMNETLTRRYSEILYEEWSLDLEDVDTDGHVRRRGPALGSEGRAGTV